MNLFYPPYLKNETDLIYHSCVVVFKDLCCAVDCIVIKQSMAKYKTLKYLKIILIDDVHLSVQ